MGLRAGKHGPGRWPCGMGAVPCPRVIPPPALDLLIRVEGSPCTARTKPRGRGPRLEARGETQAPGSSDPESLPKAREAGRKGVAVAAGTLCKMCPFLPPLRPAG